MNLEYFKEPLKVMIDPSLIVANKTYKKTFRLIEELNEENRFNFYLPKTFENLINKSKNIEDEKIFKFYLQNASAVKTKELNSKYDHHSKLIKGYEITPEQKMKYMTFYNKLKDTDSFDSYYEVLLEEWIFLQENSWIVSRIKKPFSKFVDRGSIYLYLGRWFMDSAVKTTLKNKQKEFLNNMDYLRAFGKWIAVGGSSVTSLFEPNIGIPAGLATGFFLLIDP